jgi:high-affinity iron transporter
MLFYVGIWMHSKTNAEHWQAYIQKHINSQLEAGTLWGLAVLSFIAVYREVFETVLFYQSLVTQASTTQYSFVISGFLFGVAVLSILAWGMFRYSVKLPIARFFSTTTYLLLVLSFILMGKAISALQEAAIIGITPLPINVEVTWFGIGSTWQGITAQVTILILFSLYMYRSRNRNAS